MIVLISPAKTLDFASPIPNTSITEPRFLSDSEELIAQLRELAPEEIARLMKLSDKLSELNYHRYHQWQSEHTDKNARAAILAFKGDVYLGLQAETFSLSDLKFAQNHLRILSGLYGLLRPLDQIQPYRLEMGTALSTKRGKNLYDFWGEKITEQLKIDIKNQKTNAIINLASNEYAKSVLFKQIIVPVISPVFKDWKNGEYKIISFFAKRARGLMSAYIIKNRLQKPEQLLDFNMDGYCFSPELSTSAQPMFIRKQS